MLLRLLALLCLCTTAVWAGDVPAAFHFSPNSKLVDRVREAPAVVLAELRKLDGRDDYTAYQPGKDEKQMLGACLEKLPPYTRQVLRERMLGIYCVNNFARGGHAGVVTGKSGRKYGYLVLNPEALQANITEYLSIQELRLYSQGDPYLDITVDCGTAEPAALYLLLRESTHLLIDTGAVDAAAVTGKVWEAPETPAKEYDFPARAQLNFTGLAGETAISYDKSIPIYTALQKMPFPSLLASHSRRDDSAELLAFYHLTQKLGTPYKLTVHYDFSKVEVRFANEPMKATQVAERFAGLAVFYQEK